MAAVGHFGCPKFTFDRISGHFRSILINHEIQTLQRTRQSDLIYISHCRSNYAQNLPLIKFPQIWNKWVHTKFHLHLKGPLNQNYFQPTKALCVVQIPIAQTVAHEVGDHKI